MECQNVVVELGLRDHLAAFVISNDQYFDDESADVHLQFGFFHGYLFIDKHTVDEVIQNVLSVYELCQ